MKRAGYEVITHIRENSDSAVPILVLSTVGAEPMIVEAFDLGADDYMQKPFRPNELVSRVKRLIKTLGLE